MSGAAAVFMHWCCSNANKIPDASDKSSPGVLAGWAAARLARACAAQAFANNARATITTDLIQQIQPAFQRLFESETCL